MSKFGNSERIVQNCERQRSQMWTRFDRIRPKLKEIARYVYPNALPGLEKDVREIGAGDEYEEDDAERYTSVPFDAFRIAASGFYTNLTNPASPWFSIKTPDYGEGSEDRDYYAEEYSKLTDATRWLMGWCGAYRGLNLVYKHLVAFGFGGMLLEPDDERVVRVTCLRMGTYALGIDRKGRVDRCVRRFAFTAEQMVEEFRRENLVYGILEAARRGDVETKYVVWNLVEPHRKLKGIGTPYTLSYEKFTYRSVYWCPEASGNGQDGLLAVRGYAMKPLVAPRLMFETGDVYGRGCGADALGHCRALQTMSESQLDLADQEAHPAMMAPASMADEGLRLGPLEVNWYPDNLQPNAVYRAIGQPPTGERTAREMQRLETELRKAFFNSEFETISAMEDQTAGGGEMTATEVRARVGEKMEQLAGIATTLNDELLDPFVTTMAAYAMMSGIAQAELPQGGALPWDIKYESAIHAAVNAQPINAASRSLAEAAGLAEAANDPSVFDNFDADEMVRDVHRKLGAPERYLRREKERDAMRMARAEEAARQQQMQEEAVQAKTLRDAASTPLTPGTIGGALADAGQGGMQ